MVTLQVQPTTSSATALPTHLYLPFLCCRRPCPFPVPSPPSSCNTDSSSEQKLPREEEEEKENTAEGWGGFLQGYTGTWSLGAGGRSSSTIKETAIGKEAGEWFFQEMTNWGTGEKEISCKHPQPSKVSTRPYNTQGPLSGPQKLQESLQLSCFYLQLLKLCSFSVLPHPVLHSSHSVVQLSPPPLLTIFRVDHWLHEDDLIQLCQHHWKVAPSLFYFL